MSHAGIRATTMISIIAMFGLEIVSAFSQTQTTKRPSFEVASVRPAPPVTGFPLPGGPEWNRFSMYAVNLRSLLLYAYELPYDPSQIDNRIIGGPGWLDSDRFDIQAKAEEGIPTLSIAQARLMLQSLLEDRFKLKAHLETREVSLYNLVVAKGGLKMKLSQDQGPYTGKAANEQALPRDAQGAVPRGGVRTTVEPGGRTLTGSSARLGILFHPLQPEVGRPIIDKTGLQGLYDFVIRLGPPGELSGSVFKALEDVGLRLESARGPVQVLVIDSVQKPTEN